MMDARRLVSYDDLVPLPPPAPPTTGAHPTAAASPAPNGAPFYSDSQTTTRGRKRNRHRTRDQRNHKRQRTYPQHWDDPSAGAHAPSGVPPASAPVSGSGRRSDAPSDGHPDMSIASTSHDGEDDYQDEDDRDGEQEHQEEAGVGEEEESRELTHEEIWDDQALIDAWNSAQAEYEAFHGTSKKWKTEPVKRSPLWYNKPPDPSTLSANRHSKGKGKQPTNGNAHTSEENSTPLNFDTFVPTHDASLSSNFKEPTALGQAFGATSATWGTQEEAFHNAMNAMYWTGYWTAVYHSNAYNNGDYAENGADEGEEGGEEDDGEEDEDAVIAPPDEDLVSTQR